MMLLFYIAAGFLLVYGILFWFYNKWWKQVPYFDPEPNTTWQPSVKISVLVPARNESQHIAACLSSMCLQDYPAHLFQVIMIDDSSTDDSFSIASGLHFEGIELVCLKMTETVHTSAPKKRAIEAGIAVASGDIIVTTDADCIAGVSWLKSLAAFHELTGDCFIAAPVKIESNGSILSKFQSLDFLTMQGITGAAVTKRFLNMCNGANLAYDKKVFHEVDGFAGIDNIASGDDMLFMNKVAKMYPGKLGFLKSPQAIVTTQPAASWYDFLQQRIRWASKATHYRHPGIFLVLLLVYITNLSILAVLFASFWQPVALIYFVVLCIIKFLVEIFFVSNIAAFFNQAFLLPWLLLLQPLHMIYIVMAGFLGQVKTYEWKGRKLR